jgi:hypothetical protein
MIKPPTQPMPVHYQLQLIRSSVELCFRMLADGRFSPRRLRSLALFLAEVPVLAAASIDAAYLFDAAPAASPADVRLAVLFLQDESEQAGTALARGLGMDFRWGSRTVRAAVTPDIRAEIEAEIEDRMMETMAQGLRSLVPA